MRRLAAVLSSFAVLLAAANAAHADGPPSVALTESATALRQSLACTGLDGAQREVVLLVPGTALTPREFAWNWDRALDAKGWPHCSVEVPHDGMGDIQVAAQYVVHAVRRIHAITGSKVQVVGHSQGGMVPRWALKYWPDTRVLVDDLIGLAPSNHGTADAEVLCSFPACPPAFWQQRTSARFLAALNGGGETIAGVSYTVAYTRYDEVVVPNVDAVSGSSPLRTGEGARTNVLLQDVCPGNAGEHLAAGTYDAVAHAIAVDALEHDGPADPARVDRAVCAAAFMPGVEPASFIGNEAQLGNDVAAAILGSRKVRAEPPLACYARSEGCPPEEQVRLRLSATPAKLRPAKRTPVRLQAEVVRGDGASSPARNAIVRVAGRVLRTNADGQVRTSLQRMRRPVEATVVDPLVGEATTTIGIARR